MATSNSCIDTEVDRTAKLVYEEGKECTSLITLDGRRWKSQSTSSKPLCLVPRGSGCAGIRSAPSMADILPFQFDWTGRRAFFIFIKGFRVKVACRAGVQLMPVIICILHFYSAVLCQRAFEQMHWHIWTQHMELSKALLNSVHFWIPTCNQGFCCQATWPAAFWAERGSVKSHYCTAVLYKSRCPLCPQFFISEHKTTRVTFPPQKHFSQPVQLPPVGNGFTCFVRSLWPWRRTLGCGRRLIKKKVTVKLSWATLNAKGIKWSMSGLLNIHCSIWDQSPHVWSATREK